METGFHCLLDKSVERGMGEGRFFVVMVLNVTQPDPLSLGSYGGEERRDTGRQGESHPNLAPFFCLSVVLYFG